MDRGSQILDARRKANPKVNQREIEVFLDLPSGYISGAEQFPPRVTPSEEDFGRIIDAINAIAATKREKEQCDDRVSALART